MLKLKKLEIPYLPSNDDSENEGYICTTKSERLIREHTGFDFEKIIKLRCDIYKLYLRDAYIFELQKSEGGREYLEECYNLQNTKADRKKLRAKFGIKEVNTSNG